MLLFLRLLVVGLQVFIPLVSCDFQNDKRLLEEYNSELFVLCFSYQRYVSGFLA